ncbi:unnamed protein product, partial [Agarophyton chilense]
MNARQVQNGAAVVRLWRRGLARRNWVGSKQHAVESDGEKLRQIKEQLKAKAHSLGLSLVGVTSVRKSSRFEQYKQWLQNKYHGELDYMARADRVERRGKPRLILPGAQCVIMVGMYYWPGVSGFPKLHDVRRLHERNGETAGGRATRGVVSSYAWGEDYHKTLERKLKTLAQYLNAAAGGVGRFYVDTGAILERDFAERAGLGFIGKNSLLINARGGSGFFIGELFSTVALALDGDEERGTRGDVRGKAGCGACTRCITACPTGAIVRDRVVDARRCISYLTVELDGVISARLRTLMGNRVYGCDICQQVCPWNRVEWGVDEQNRAATEGHSPLSGAARSAVASPSLVGLLRMSDAAFAKRFGATAMRRAGRARLARN